MTTTYVSIGRNVGAEPMPSEQWDAYRARVRAAVVLGHDGGQLVTSAVGVGEYDGAREDAAVYAHTGTPNDSLRPILALLAREYRQESIALSIAEPEFVR